MKVCYNVWNTFRRARNWRKKDNSWSTRKWGKLKWSVSVKECHPRPGDFGHRGISTLKGATISYDVDDLIPSWKVRQTTLFADHLPACVGKQGKNGRCTQDSRDSTTYCWCDWLLECCHLQITCAWVNVSKQWGLLYRLICHGQSNQRAIFKSGVTIAELRAHRKPGRLLLKTFKGEVQ